jgi:DNA-binding NarL/FixJ family response regulator
MSGAPFAERPFAAAIPAERATWEAERTRLAGASDPDAWGRAAQAWQDLGCPQPSPPTKAPYGLTGRELAVLRLLAAGRSNAQIGAELYISPKTASVHVTSILRKLGITSRVQAAALAERAGFLTTTESPKAGRAAI